MSAKADSRLPELRTLLDDVVAFVRRYVVLTDAQVDAIALWIAHTHALAAAETTPYLNITSAEKESGKSRLLEVMNEIVAKPWYTGRTSCSVLARKIDAETPTLLLDEGDAVFAGERTYVEELRGLLNVGFRRGGKQTINIASGQGGWVPTDFSVFCAKAFAGIGGLPDTVVSRSLTIRMRRKRPDDVVEKLRLRLVSAVAEPLREKLERTLPPLVPRLVEIVDANPEMPDGLSDRAEDVWEPLLAIADLVGGAWPERARHAAVELSGQRSDDENSHRIRLLADIRSIFERRPVDEIASFDLVVELNAIEESPWPGWSGGRGLTTNALARQLKPFEITPRHTRDGLARGYKRSQFEDAFSRYLPPLRPATVKASEDEPPDEDGQLSPSVAAFGGSRAHEPRESGGTSDGLTVSRTGAIAPATAAGPQAHWTAEYAEEESERIRAKFADLFNPNGNER
jgi:hypothetical protein